MSNFCNLTVYENQYDSLYESSGVAVNAAMGLDLPERYGIDRIVLLYQDPATLFCYWEIDPQRLQQVAPEADLAGVLEREQLVLRIYFSEGKTIERDVSGFAGSAYIDVTPGAGVIYSELGIHLPKVGFLGLSISNRIHLPPPGMAPVDSNEKWAPCEHIYPRLEAPCNPAASGLRRSSALSSEALVRK